MIEKSNFKITCYLLLLIVIFPVVLFAQNNKNKQEKLKAAKEFSEIHKEKWLQKRREAEQKANITGIPVTFVDKIGNVHVLQEYISGVPLYLTTANENAAKTISTGIVHENPYYLNGNSILAVGLSSIDAVIIKRQR